MKNTDPFDKADLKLNWTKNDIEQRFGFHGGRFTTANSVFTFIMALLLAGAFYATLVFWLRGIPQAKAFCDIFLERGIPTYFIVVFFCWSLSILFVKGSKLREQRRALTIKPVPVDPDFVLNRETANEVLLRLRSIVDNTGHYVLLNRVDRALSIFKTSVGSATSPKFSGARRSTMRTSFHRVSRCSTGSCGRRPCSDSSAPCSV